MGADAHAATLVKGLLVAAALVLFSLAIVAGGVFGLGDDELLVSPPETVVQEFVRAMALGQIATARRMLSREAERRTSSDEVRRVSLAFRARLGRLAEVRATVVGHRRDTAVVRAHIEGERSTAETVLSLIREYGAWSVTSASDLLTTDTRTSSHPAHR